MRKITKFPKLVIEEAKNLRKLALPVEKERLDFAYFNDNSYMNCIYGQLTGDCHSERAMQLMCASAKRVYIPERQKDNPKSNANPGESKRLNGKPKFTGRRDEITFWSPIEVFVNRENTPEAMKKQLLEFIKGTRKRLV